MHDWQSLVHVGACGIAMGCAALVTETCYGPSHTSTSSGASLTQSFPAIQPGWQHRLQLQPGCPRPGRKASARPLPDGR